MAVFRRLHFNRTGILFVVGILVLGGLVTGGIFLVKNHGEVVRHDQAVKVAEQNLKDQSQTSTQTTNSANNSGETGASTGTSAANSANGATSTDTTTPSTTPSTSNTAALPVTGIDAVQFLEQAAILGILALSVGYYVTSRRAAQQL